MKMKAAKSTDVREFLPGAEIDTNPSGNMTRIRITNEAGDVLEFRSSSYEDLKVFRKAPPKTEMKIFVTGVLRTGAAIEVPCEDETEAREVVSQHEPLEDPERPLKIDRRKVEVEE